MRSRQVIIAEFCEPDGRIAAVLRHLDELIAGHREHYLTFRDRGFLDGALEPLGGQLRVVDRVAIPGYDVEIVVLDAGQPASEEALKVPSEVEATTPVAAVDSGESAEETSKTTSAASPPTDAPQPQEPSAEGLSSSSS